MAVQLLTHALAKWAYPLLWSITATTPWMKRQSFAGLVLPIVRCHSPVISVGEERAKVIFSWNQVQWNFYAITSFRYIDVFSQLIVLQLIRTSNLIGPLWVARSSFVVGLGSILNFVCLLFSQPISWGLPRDARSPNSFSYILRLLGLKKSFVTSMPLLYSSSLHRSSTQGPTCCFARPLCLNFLIVLWVSPYVPRRCMLRFLIEVNRWGWNFCRLLLLYDFPTSCIVFYFE